MSERYDAIVVGGGHNGLVCACYLARAGLAVALLERHTSVGGAAVTEEFHPGFRNSAASYTVSLLRQKIIDELELERHGLAIVPRPLANFVPALAGPGLELHREVGATQKALERHSRRDAEHYPGFVAELLRITRLLKSLLLEAPVDPSGGLSEKVRALAVLARARRLGRADWAALWTLLTGSAGDWLDRWFEGDLLKGAFGFDSIVGHFASPYSSGSGYLLLHHALGDIRELDGAWGHAIGGMGSIASALAAAARERGVAILCGHAVDRIEPVRGGFEVYSGSRVLGARVAASAIHPQLLFTKLLDASLLPEDFVSRIMGLRSESATFRANVALSELPDFTCLPGVSAAPHHGSGILIAPSLRYLDTAYRDALDAGRSQRPVIEIVIPSILDETLAPRGLHVASLFCQHFRYRLPADGQWQDVREAALADVIETVGQYAPNFPGAVIAAEARSPVDLERRFGLVGGDIFHGAMSLDQLYWARPAWGYAQYRTPVEGLYLCGSGAHPGGGVTGAPGHNAARAILADLGKRRRPRKRAASVD